MALLLLNLILLVVAVGVSLLPPRQSLQHKTVGLQAKHDTIVRIDRREQQQPEHIDDTPPPVTSPQHSPAPPPDAKAVAESSPFYKEAAKVLAGNLTEEDANSRRTILSYCERLRTAYTTKDLAFIRQVFSEKALIVVGHVVKERNADAAVQLDQPQEKVQYFVHSKQQYLQRLSRVFSANATIDVTFSEFRIMRHPTMAGIYGVTMRQAYRSSRYSDDGRLFLLWDFRNPQMPLIHVRVWQASAHDDIITLSDFNLQ